MDNRLQRAVRERAQGLADYVVATRRDIHTHPELGNQEQRTAALVAATVRDLGFEVQEHVATTGVIAVLRGAQPGPTLALRADMDALPLNEEAERPYRSCVPGVMHACGHDGHTAMLLGTAKVLAGLRGELHGNVKFLFQPAEETYGGASEMIADGCLTNAPAVDAIFGLHVWPDGDVGELRVRSGPVMASADALRIVVHGKGGHASEPHDGIDPVPIAAHIITQLQTLVTRRFDAKSPVVITITYLQAGTALNVLPPDAIIAGTVRSVEPAARAALPARIEELAQHTAAAFGASAEVTYIHGSGVVVNDADFTDFVRRSIRAARGADAVQEVPYAIMGAEDFGAYLERVPGSMAFLGARPSHQEAFPCHHPRFDLNEAALPIGVEILSTVALEYLKRRQTTD